MKCFSFQCPNIFSPVIFSNFYIAEDNWGNDVGALKGKTFHKIPTQVKIDLVELPKWLIKLYNKVFLGVDVVLINKIPFMVSVLRNIKFNTVHNMKNINKATLIGVIDAIIAHYSRGGSHINTLLMDY